jgi:NADH dehydrogenase
VLDAAGPEIFSFNDLVHLIASRLGRKARIVHAPPGLLRPMLRLLEPFVGDVVLTREEIDGLLDNLLVSRQTPAGTTRLSEWLQRNASTVGATYASELKRHYR